MDFLPIFLRLTDQPALVVGGGTIAARKVGLLQEANARITVISPELETSLAKLKADGKIEHIQGEYIDGMIKDFQLIIAATDNAEINAKVSEQAKALNIPVNVVDQPALCSFIMPSIVDRSPVVVAVSTGGSSPVLARMIRARLETLIPASYGRLASLVQKYRTALQSKFTDVELKRKFWERTLEGKVPELVFSGRDKEAETLLQATLKDVSESDLEEQGEVYLVGAGPGDPDLLTFRALRLMQRADVVLHDRLVSDEIVAMVRRD
ncbi:MAG: NAD(P)-dependent oxidoreductase, partial [Arenicellales bacterium]